MPVSFSRTRLLYLSVGSRFRRGGTLAFVLVLLFPGPGGCLSPEQAQQSSGAADPGQWELQQWGIAPEWSEPEEQVPFVLAGLPSDAPERFVLPGMLAPGDQLGQASGTAWAVGYAATTYLFRTKRNQHDYECAPAFIYNQLNERADRGIEIIEAAELVKRMGCPRENLMPYQAADYVSRPTAAALADAREHRIRGYGRVDFVDLNQIRAHLLQGSVVIVTLRISENFIGLRENVWENPAGRQRGRHTLAVIGYDNAQGAFIVQNSAGGRWGSYGRAAIPYVWFVRLAQKAYVVW